MAAPQCGLSFARRFVEPSRLKMNPQEWKLIVLALAAIGVLVLLITRLQINAFISLILASLIVGGGAVLLDQQVKDAGGKWIPYTLVGVAKSLQDGLGATLGGIAAVLGLGTMLGKLLAESGGAEVLAKRLAKLFGPQRIQWCVIALSLVVGLATWFAVGLVLLLPILLTLTRETRQPFLRLALPLLACLSVMHGLMPPHPGPVVAVEALKASMGLVLFWGFVVGLPTALIAGPLFAKWAVKHVPAEAPPVVIASQTNPAVRPPGFGLTLFSILLPVLLMLFATVAELTWPKGHTVREAGTFIGHPTIALLGATIFCLWSLGTHCGYAPTQLLKFTEQSIAAVGMTILVVGGGGGFARVLRDSGVADAMGKFGDQLHLSPLLYGWLIAVFIRVATGSATVAITTASGLLGPVLALHPELTPTHVALIIVAMGCGSLFLSHLNDGGFWIVKDCLGLNMPQTLKTWTVCETIVGIVGMLLALLCYHLVKG
jgi:gluconate:H+ symporter, GntP family